MSACRSCGAEIQWAQVEKTGKKMPLDAHETAGGNIVVVTRIASDYGGMTPVVRYVANGQGNRLSHFATCENAAEHRKR